MELKYTSKDFDKIMNAFVNIAKGVEGKKQITVEDFKDLLDYPTEVLEIFLKSIVLFNDYQIKNKYIGIKCYILMRMNFCCE